MTSRSIMIFVMSCGLSACDDGRKASMEDAGDRNPDAGPSANAGRPTPAHRLMPAHRPTPADRPRIQTPAANGT
jgi:hypothetical protein